MSLDCSSVYHVMNTGDHSSDLHNQRLLTRRVSTTKPLPVSVHYSQCSAFLGLTESSAQAHHTREHLEKQQAALQLHASHMGDECSKLQPEKQHASVGGTHLSFQHLELPLVEPKYDALQLQCTHTSVSWGASPAHACPAIQARCILYRGMPYILGSRLD